MENRRRKAPKDREPRTERNTCSTFYNLSRSYWKPCDVGVFPIVVFFHIVRCHFSYITRM